jgi:hypothetical protein
MLTSFVTWYLAQAGIYENLSVLPAVYVLANT